ncbi:hypothetical protein EJ02DRAFT_95687 [Clathrospora elynae]|uniref:Uncharacterized protein n=1 Tax=Clathrospora elynae TaxID=706981 RepID=A0A6A5SV86_9PLEO|nr:hypothetical protein EJ02DRAFT_95687 [Clathrospora elynae]
MRRRNWNASPIFQRQKFCAMYGSFAIHYSPPNHERCGGDTVASTLRGHYDILTKTGPDKQQCTVPMRAFRHFTVKSPSSRRVDQSPLRHGLLVCRIHPLLFPSLWTYAKTRAADHSQAPSFDIRVGNRWRCDVRCFSQSPTARIVRPVSRMQPTTLS